jgi:hypothetical protein
MNRTIVSAVCLTLLYFVVSPTFAQPPDVIWQMSFPALRGINYPASIVQHPEGDLILGWNHHIGLSDRQGEVIRATTDGDLVWMSHPEFVEGIKTYVHDVAVGADGYSWLVGLHHIPWGGRRPMVAKLSAGGVVAWQVLTDDTNREPRKVLPLTVGGAVVTAIGGRIYRISEQGNLVWNRWLNGEARTYYEIADAIEYQSGLLFAGRWEETNQPADLVFIHTDLDGNTIWETMNTIGDQHIAGIVRREGGGFVSLSSSDSNQLTVSWYDPDGNYESHLEYDLFRKNYRGPEDIYSAPILIMPDGGFLLGGRTVEFQAKLIRTDHDGAIVWQQTMSVYNLEAVITDIELLNNNRIQCVGMIYGGYPTTWTMQLAAEGEVVDGGPVEMKPFELPYVDSEE